MSRPRKASHRVSTARAWVRSAATTGYGARGGPSTADGQCHDEIACTCDIRVDGWAGEVGPWLRDVRVLDP